MLCCLSPLTSLGIPGLPPYCGGRCGLDWAAPSGAGAAPPSSAPPSAPAQLPLPQYLALCKRSLSAGSLHPLLRAMESSWGSGGPREAEGGEARVATGKRFKTGPTGRGSSGSQAGFKALLRARPGQAKQPSKQPLSCPSLGSSFQPGTLFMIPRRGKERATPRAPARQPWKQTRVSRAGAPGRPRTPPCGHPRHSTRAARHPGPYPSPLQVPGCFLPPTLGSPAAQGPGQALSVYGLASSILSVGPCPVAYLSADLASPHLSAH